MKKCCVVLTKSQILYIEQHEGVSFSEKLRMIIERDRLFHGDKLTGYISEKDKYEQLQLDAALDLMG